MNWPLFRAVVPAHPTYPSTLVWCDLADFKRRNAHLGHELGDRDIEAFDRGVSRACEQRGASVGARVGGNQWLLLCSEPDALVAEIAASYCRSDPYKAGWRCVGMGMGRSKVIEQTVQTVIVRSCRFVGLSVAAEGELQAGAELLERDGWGTEPGVYTAWSEDMPRDFAGWECVRRYPTSYPYCPFCGGVDFDWIDGDSGVYSAEGTCRACRAEVEIQDAGELLPEEP